MDQPRADIKDIFYTQPVFISYILEKDFLYSSYRRFLYRSRPYWRFFSFSFPERFPYRSWAYWHFLFFSCSERFWYLLRSFFESFSLLLLLLLFWVFFEIILLTFLSIEKNLQKNILSVFLYVSKINFTIWVI